MTAELCNLASCQRNHRPPHNPKVATGPRSYEFSNAPLVLDYMELKWSCTVPKWPHKYPLNYRINEGFYTYGNEDRDDPPDQKLERRPTRACYLLR